jgi:hypothetical protein
LRSTENYSNAGVESEVEADSVEENEDEGSQADPGSPQASRDDSSEDEDQEDNNGAAYREAISPVAIKSVPKRRLPLPNIAPSQPSSSQLRQTQEKQVDSDLETIILLPNLMLQEVPSPPSSPKKTTAETQALNRTKAGARGSTQQQMTVASQNVELVEATRKFLEAAKLGYVLLDVIWGRHRFHGDYINNRPLIPNWVARLFQDFSFGSGIRSSMFPLSIGVLRGELPEDFEFAADIGEACKILTLEGNAQLNIFVANGNHRCEAAHDVYADSQEGKKVLKAKIKLGAELWDEDEEGVTFTQAEETYRLIKIKSRQARYLFAEVYDKGMCER